MSHFINMHFRKNSHVHYVMDAFTYFENERERERIKTSRMEDTYRQADRQREERQMEGKMMDRQADRQTEERQMERKMMHRTTNR